MEIGVKVKEKLIKLYKSLKQQVYQVSGFLIFKDAKGEVITDNAALLVDYIKDYIDIVINVKVETKLKEMNAPTTHVTRQEHMKYEGLIKKLEDEIRGHIKVKNFLIKVENEMKMHIEFLESTYEKYETLKKENEGYGLKLDELGNKLTNSEIELENVRSENKNLKEIIKLNEVYFKQKECSLKTKISDLQKKASFLYDDRLNYSQDKNKTTMTIRADDPFEKVKRLYNIIEN
jgi:hypothetical protein